MDTGISLQLVKLWEQGRNADWLERGLLLLAAAQPGVLRDELLDRSIGQRDRALFEWRRVLFGKRLDATVACPVCTEQLEFAVELDELLATQAGEIARDTALRAPTTRDLLTLPADGGPADLIQRIAVADSEIADVEVDELLALLDPLADLHVALTCPQCHHEWNAQLDIVTCLWTEIDAWVRRTLYEVHLIASIYHWNETEILALSPLRRQMYLDWIGGGS